MGPFSSLLSHLPGFTLLCAHLQTAVKTDLPMKWNSDTEHSRWTPGYDGAAYFSLCQPFSCGKEQKKVRDTNVVLHSFPKYFLSAWDVPGMVPGGEVETDFPSSWSRHLGWKRKKINNKYRNRVGKWYRIIEGELYYGKENRKTE